LIIIALWQKPDDKLSLNFLDVGQGDSIYVRTKNDQDMLIDGGPENTVLEELGEVMPFYDREINYIVLTHPHSDHISGLLEVLKRYKVDAVFMTDVMHTTEEYKEFLSIIQEKQIPTKIVRADDIINIDTDVNFQVFWPIQSYAGQKIDNLNNTSIVGRLTYKNFSLMLTGDAEKDVLDKIASNNSNENLSSQILKISHHGSKNAISDNFYQKVNPTHAIISVGADNKFGHPNKETIDKLLKFNINTLRTDQLGIVKFSSNGDDFILK